MALNQVNVGNIGNKLATGTQTANAGFQGDSIVSAPHGKWYSAALAGRVFVGSALIAGVTIPVNTTTAPTFTLFNPLTSKVALELISLDIGFPAAAATVVGTILLSMGAQTPTSPTSGGVTVTSLIGASAVSQAALYSAATITAVTSHMPLFTYNGTANTSDGPPHYDFDGKVIIQPGGFVTLTSTPVQTAVSLPSFIWAEWPLPALN